MEQFIEDLEDDLEYLEYDCFSYLLFSFVNYLFPFGRND